MMSDINDIFEQIDPEKLLISINSGEGITETELKKVGTLLESVDENLEGLGLSVDEIYSLLLVIARSRGEKYRYLMERFLESKDAFTVSMILETLCLDWGYTEEYLERILNFALSVSWDNEADVQLTAVKILGEYLHSELHVEKAKGSKGEGVSKWMQPVMELLFGVFQDEHGQSWVRQAAYYAICRAYGKQWAELPGECAVLDLSKESTDIDWEMLKHFAQYYKVQFPTSSSSV